MTRRDEEVPFTVTADFDPTSRPGLALRAQGADVAVRRQFRSCRTTHEIPGIAPFSGHHAATVIVGGGR